MDAWEPVVTAAKYIAYKKSNGHFGDFKAPNIVLVCYQQQMLTHLINHYPEHILSESFSELYSIHNGNVGILAGWGYGAPALVTKLEQLIVLGVKKFIAIGLAGTLIDVHEIGDFVISKKALAEDGVSHHYLPKGTHFSEAHPAMVQRWSNYALAQNLPQFHDIPTWSFSAIFRETPADIRRVKALGCGIVEMEAATLFAVGEEKGVETLSLFVISDAITEEQWQPKLREPLVRSNLGKLADWALHFCETEN